LSLGGVAWSAAFGLFVPLCRPALPQPRAMAGAARPL